MSTALLIEVENLWRSPLLKLLAVYHPALYMLSLHQAGIFHFIDHSELAVPLPKVPSHCHALPLTQRTSLHEKKLAALEDERRDQALQVAFSHRDAPLTRSAREVVFLLKMNCISPDFSTCLMHIRALYPGFSIFLTSFSTYPMPVLLRTTFSVKLNTGVASKK